MWLLRSYTLHFVVFKCSFRAFSLRKSACCCQANSKSEPKQLKLWLEIPDLKLTIKLYEAETSYS